ncbi:hypothetical protein GH714_015613 [Hevea brasiliensis]|uniref:Uncharacterized protein n=1 Tax=Hevea brasiliensis TaxID=3981 RepID=A0A6A6KS86_HEVBR|nr:hypothetical protein GH714_015613 [Hevea brasiliensis]
MRYRCVDASLQLYSPPQTTARTAEVTAITTTVDDTDVATTNEAQNNEPSNKKDQPAFEDNPGDLPADAIKSDDLKTIRKNSQDSQNRELNADQQQQQQKETESSENNQQFQNTKSYEESNNDNDKKTLESTRLLENLQMRYQKKIRKKE